MYHLKKKHVISILCEIEGEIITVFALLMSRNFKFIIFHNFSNYESRVFPYTSLYTFDQIKVA